MKARQWVWPVAGALSLVLSACGPGYIYGAGNGGYVSVGTGWQSAWYDQDGFPIYGYEGGRPVYGYTSAGAAIFSLSLLTSDCYVPHWEPASWYRGSYRYPVRVKRVSAPPRHPAAHKPSFRPDRPKSKAENHVVHRNNTPAAGHPNTPPRVNSPSTHPGTPSRPQYTAPGGQQPNRPQIGGKQPTRPSAGQQPDRPQAGNTPQPGRPQQVGQPAGSKPQTIKPQTGKPQVIKPQASKPTGGRPQAGKMPSGDKPGVGKPSGKPAAAPSGRNPVPPSKSQVDRGTKH